MVNGSRLMVKGSRLMVLRQAKRQSNRWFKVKGSWLMATDG